MNRKGRDPEGEETCLSSFHRQNLLLETSMDDRLAYQGAVRWKRGTVQDIGVGSTRWSRQDWILGSDGTFARKFQNRSTFGCSTINTSANTRLKLHQCLGDIMRRKGSLATLVKFGDASTVAFMRNVEKLLWIVPDNTMPIS